MNISNRTNLVRFRGAVSVVSLIAAIAFYSSAALSQEAPAGAAGANQIETVIVTAEKRAENVQRVPISISAFTSQDIRDKSIQDVNQLGRLTPNVNLDTASPFGGSQQILSASIRGIGQDDFAFNLDPGVGVYVDGIYLARTVGANQDLLDVDRVEILKGPQGTLFGRNTIGGAINIVTRTPGDQYMFDGVITVGSFDRRDFQGTADIPISENLLTSITFASLNRDGYQKRIPYPSPTPYVTDPSNAFISAGTQTFNTLGGQDQDVLRGKAVWTPAAHWTVTLSADWTHIDESSTPESLLDTVTSLGVQGAAFGAFYNLCIEGTFLPNVCGPRGPGLSGGNSGVTTGNASIFGANLNPATYRLPFGNQFITKNIDQSYATGPDFNREDTYGGALTIDWSLAQNMDLKSITGYRKLDWAVGVDPDGSPIDMNDGSFTINQHQVSQEFQLTGDALDDRIKYSAGLYYFNEGGVEHDYVTLGDGLLQINGPTTLDTSSYAAYTHIDYEIIDRLTLIAGARYSYDQKSIIEPQQDLNAFNYKISGCYPVTAACAAAIGFPVPTSPLQYTPNGTHHQDFHTFTPTLGAQYQFNNDVMAYFTYAEGYKDGGWTTRVTQPVPVLPTFGPEKSDTYELGLKSEWLDHTLQVNLAGFATKYSGIQLNFQEGISPTIRNAGDADIRGGELEANWLLGHGFSIAGTVGYTDAYYTYLEPGINYNQSCIQPFEPCITLNSKLPKTPKWKATLSPQYVMQLNNAGAMRFGLDYTHTSQIFNDAINTSLLRRPVTDLLDASITYMSPDDRYEISVGGSNITNERYLVTGNEDTAGGILYGTYNPPAEWYLRGRVRF